MSEETVNYDGQNQEEAVESKMDAVPMKYKIENKENITHEEYTEVRKNTQEISYESATIENIEEEIAHLQSQGLEVTINLTAKVPKDG